MTKERICDLAAEIIIDEIRRLPPPSAHYNDVLGRLEDYRAIIAAGVKHLVECKEPPNGQKDKT